MHFRTFAVAGLAVAASLVSPGPAFGAAGPQPRDYVGKRVSVDIDQLLVYTDPATSYVGSLRRGASFTVIRLSPTRVYAYGFAYGNLNRRGWVETSGLTVGAEFQVRQVLTATTELRGTVAFTTPPGWAATNRSASHSSATFDVGGPGGCSLALSVSMRGVATKDSLGDQVRQAVGDASLGNGARSAGVWGTAGPLLGGGEGDPPYSGLYGIAPIRVRANRFGQIRILGSLQGCKTGSSDAATFLRRGGPVVKAVNRLLVDATPNVRVVTVRRR